MKLRELELISFASFKDYKIIFPPEKSFHIIFGNNEAGKSTILRAIIALFYGIHPRTTDNFFHDKLLIGGRISNSSAEKDDGLYFIRRKGNKNTILDENNNPLSDNILNSYLNNVDKDAFTAMFGMDHLRLREGGESILKGGGVIGETLFETATGLGHVREIFKRLEKEAGDLYKKGAAKPLINNNLRMYREAKKNLKDISMPSSRWKDLEKQYQEEKSKAKKMSEEIVSLQRKIAFSERIKRILPLAAERKDYLFQLTLLGDIPKLRVDFREERKNIFILKEKNEEEKKRLLLEIGDLEERLGEIDISEDLFKNIDRISNLHEQLDAYRNCMADIPKLREEENNLREETMSVLRDINPAYSSLEESEKLLLSHDKKEDIRRLSQEKTNISKSNIILEEQIRTLKSNLEKKEIEKSKIGIAHEINHLKNSLQRLLKSGDPEEQLQKIAMRSETIQGIVDNELSSLGLWQGESAGFINLQLPLLETVSKYETLYDDLFRREKDISKDIKRCEEVIREKKNAITENETVKEVPAEEVLLKNRAKRDYGWSLVKNAWLNKVVDPDAEKAFDSDNPLEKAYAISVQKADSIADLRYKEASVVAAKEEHLFTIRKTEEELLLLQKEKSCLDEEKVKRDNEWEVLWKDLGIKPLSPKEMNAWLQKCQKIREKINSITEFQKETKSIREQIKAHTIELIKRFAELKIESKSIAFDENELKEMPPQDDFFHNCFKSLIEEAQKIVSESEKKGENIRRNNEEIESIKYELSGTVKKKEGIEKEISSWEESWQKSMSFLNLPPDTACEVAQSQISKTEELLNKKKELQKLIRRIDTLMKYKNDFEDTAKAVIESSSNDFIGESYQLAVTALSKRAEKAGKDNATFNELKKRLDDLKRNYRSAAKLGEEIALSIDDFLKEAEAVSIEELLEKEEKYYHGESLRQEIQRLEKDILREAEGLSLEEVLKEIDVIDSDVLLAELSEKRHQLSVLEEERINQERLFGAVKKEYEEKLSGNNDSALNAAEKTESILAQISDDAERYMHLRLAVAVLRKSIEYYRQNNQDPILHKASTLFSRLTLASFSGLSVEYDDKDDAILVGVRSHGETVTVNGMSDGTQDQLYLALRLAFIEKYCEESTPLPLIIDDILINFDDLRAAETLKILVELAGKTQIVFFTHHSKMIDLAAINIPAESLSIHKIN